MICPKCNFENDSDARFCEKCGTELKQQTSTAPQKKSKRRRTAIIMSIFVVLISVIVVIFFYYRNYGPKFNISQFSVSGSENGHNYVDLGLPSGTLWATCNVGTCFPEGYGDYYAWGETKSKIKYDWETNDDYKWGVYNDADKENFGMTKYNKIDGQYRLSLEDDAAHINWGGSWRIPTYNEHQELFYECEHKWRRLNGCTGYKVTGPNGNSIFLPAAGRIDNYDLDRAGRIGYYISSSLNVEEPYRSLMLHFYSGIYGRGYYPRCCGLTVRPVCSPR